MCVCTRQHHEHRLTYTEHTHSGAFFFVPHTSNKAVALFFVPRTHTQFYLSASAMPLSSHCNKSVSIECQHTYASIRICKILSTLYTHASKRMCKILSIVLHMKANVYAQFCL